MQKTVNYEEIFQAISTSGSIQSTVIVKKLRLELLFEQLRKVIVPHFCNCLQTAATNTKLHHQNISSSLETVVGAVDNIVSLGNEFEVADTFEKAGSVIRSSVLQHLSAGLLKSFDDYFLQMFKVHESILKDRNIDVNDSSDDLTVECALCCEEVERCICSDLFRGFLANIQVLSKLGLYTELCGIAIDNSVEVSIEQHVKEICQGTFEVSNLIHFDRWLSNTVMKWLEFVLPSQLQQACELTKVLEKLKNKLYHVFIDSRKQQLFNIIIDYPESQPALEDLRFCLEVTNKYKEIMQSLTYSLQSRLLHPGVNTTDILTAYVSTMKSLNILDPSGAMLEAICIPVRNYLKRREDTIRCIVTSLTDDSAGDLAEELTRSTPASHAYQEEGAEQAYEHWEPEPIHAPADVDIRSGKKGDIITTLVSIYGGQELFVKEYQNLLSTRLLAQVDPNLDREIKYLELLKLRFGESQLHSCEVMLQDVLNSKRMNPILADFLASDRAAIPIDGTVISSQYWPQARDDAKVNIPSDMQHYLNLFKTAYEKLKVNRTLHWRPQLGFITVELELNSKKIEVTTSPVNVAVLWKFQESDSWKVEELTKSLDMTVSQLRQKIGFWVKQGLLKEDQNSIYLAEQFDNSTRSVERIHDLTNDEDDAMGDATKKESCMESYWNYIHGMLTNLESLSAERIFHMLSMFAVPNGNEFVVDDVVSFLESQVKAGVLVYSAGAYKLMK